MAKSKSKRGPMKFRDVMEITSGQSEKNARIPGRVDSKTGESIPDGMPMWLWRTGRFKKEQEDGKV